MFILNQNGTHNHKNMLYYAKGDMGMTLHMTINNADTRLIDAIKSVVRLSPRAEVSFEEV